MKGSHTKNLDLPREGFARPCQVAHALGISKATLYNYIQRGLFPPPQRLSGRITRWPVDVIRKHIKEQGGFIEFEPNCQDNPPTPAS